MTRQKGRLSMSPVKRAAESGSPFESLTSALRPVSSSHRPCAASDLILTGQGIFKNAPNAVITPANKYANSCWGEGIPVRLCV